MPLALTDPRWSDLHTSYGEATEVVAWLTAAQEQGLSEDRLGELINEVTHQGGTSTAMYAVAPHLVALARRAKPEHALPILTNAGILYATAEGSCVVPCPEFLFHEFVATGRAGAELLAPLIPKTTDFDGFKWAMAAMAGFMGHSQFARFLDGLDLYQGDFHHVLLDEPFPPV
jgi:hypothetical protein